MIRKILKTIGLILLILVLLLTVVVVLGTVLRDEMLLSPWGTGFFVIASGSMEPNIPKGSIIMVRSVPQDKISVGDAITYFASDMATVVTHRVVDIYDKGETYYYTTRGDDNNSDDAPSGYDRVIGRVVFSVPATNFFISAFNNAKHLGVVIIGAGVILFILGMFSVKK